MIDFNEVSAPPLRYDLDAIVARLRETAAVWVPRHFPNGRREGDEWRLANIKGDPPRKNGSCVIALKGPHAGDWYDHDGGLGGGPLSTLDAATGLKGGELYAHAAETVGWSPGAPARQPQPAYRADRDITREIAFILEHAPPIDGTPAATYLRGRGLAVPDSADLLFRHDLTHWETKTGFPALIGVVRDRAGEPLAVHRTYLQADPEHPSAVVKAAVSKPRMMLGKVAGGSVRLAPIGEDGTLGLSEGIETGLAVMTACPGLAVWATLSATNLEQVQLPPEAQRIVILADHDASGAGTRAAETAMHRLRAEGRRVAIARPPHEGEDFNDLLLREGPGPVAAIVEAAMQSNADDGAAKTIGRHLPIGFADPAVPLPALRADDGDLNQAVNRAWGILLASNRTPWLFRAGGLPSWIVPDDEGRPVAVQVTDERLRHMLAKLCVWRRVGRNGDLVPAHPPTALVKSLLATPDPSLPVLAGIVTAPVFGRNSTLLTTPGYHPDARLLYWPAPRFKVPAIASRPSAEDIAAARSLICDELLGDFPFVSPPERAHAVALLLLGFLRAMIEGPTPLHLIEKPSPGTGATLMVDAIATILTGVGASVMTEGRDDEEWRKRVTAKLRQIPSLVLIDNLRQRLDSAALAAALTAPFWEDRILGVSEMARLPIRCVWIATGNNPEFSNEMARRLVRIRLDAHVERPWQRDGFRHPDLMTWVRANRARLVAACLTLCQAWIASGRPRGCRTIGSYENWAAVLGGVLEVAGIDGFLGNLDEMMEASDSEGVVWRSFVSAWWERFGTAEVGAGDLYDLALSCDPPLPLGSGNDRSQRTRLGKALGRLRDRVFDIDGLKIRLRVLGVSHQAKRWQLALERERGERLSGLSEAKGGERLSLEGNVSSERSPAYPIENKASGERGECGERFSMLTRARGRVCIKDTGKRSPPSPCSLNADNSEGYAGERRGERLDQRSPLPDPPDWLKEVP